MFLSRQEIVEILLKLALNTNQSIMFLSFLLFSSLIFSGGVQLLFFLFPIFFNSIKSAGGKLWAGHTFT
jgi:hypothetical protein